MATVVPAIRGKMGSTEYFETTMPARELARATRAASETDEWTDASIEERIQRDLNKRRVEAEIVPYLLKSNDRFFGSLIVLVEGGELIFEDVQAVGAKIPAAYKAVAKDLGFLTIDGVDLIVLDGQHRLAALRKVVQHDFIVDDETAGNRPADEVGQDEICVIFIQFESNEKTRRIFNKVNRYAKTTSRSDNIITSEDDGYAIVARKLVDKGAVLGVSYKGELIVEWKSNTIARRSTKLTTISAIYETVKDIVEAEGLGAMDEKKRVVRPSSGELDSAYEAAEIWWCTLLDGIDVLGEGVADPVRLPEMRESHEQNLLLRPNGQIALIKGLAKAVERGLSLKTAVDRANKIDWSIESEIWSLVLVKRNGGMIARSEAYEAASNLICYLVAKGKMTEPEIDSLRRHYAELRGEADTDTPHAKLPELPDPVG